MCLHENGAATQCIAVYGVVDSFLVSEIQVKVEAWWQK